MRTARFILLSSILLFCFLSLVGQTTLALTQTPSHTPTPTPTPTPTLTPAPLPDLTVAFTEFEFDSSGCNVVGFWLLVANEGSADVPETVEIRVAFFSEQQVVMGLAAGDTTRVVFNVNIDSDSISSGVIAFVDLFGTIQESDESNNRSIPLFSLPTPAPYCQPTSTPVPPTPTPIPTLVPPTHTPVPPTSTPLPTPFVDTCSYVGDRYSLSVTPEDAAVGDIITISHGFYGYGGSWSITANGELLTEYKNGTGRNHYITTSLFHVEGSDDEYILLSEGDITLQLSGYGEIGYASFDSSTGECYGGWTYSRISSDPLTISIAEGVRPVIPTVTPRFTPTPTPFVDTCSYVGDRYSLSVIPEDAAVGDIVTISHGFYGYGGSWSITANGALLTEYEHGVGRAYYTTTRLSHVEGSSNQYILLSEGDITLQLSGYGEIGYTSFDSSTGECYDGWTYSGISSDPLTISIAERNSMSNDSDECGYNNGFKFTVMPTGLAVGDTFELIPNFDVRVDTWQLYVADQDSDELLANGGDGIETDQYDTQYIVPIGENQYEIMREGEVYLRMSGDGEELLTYFNPNIEECVSLPIEAQFMESNQVTLKFVDSIVPLAVGVGQANLNVSADTIFVIVGIGLAATAAMVALRSR